MFMELSVMPRWRIDENRHCHCSLKYKDVWSQIFALFNPNRCLRPIGRTCQDFHAIVQSLPELAVRIARKLARSRA